MSQILLKAHLKDSRKLDSSGFFAIILDSKWTVESVLKTLKHFFLFWNLLYQSHQGKFQILLPQIRHKRRNCWTSLKIDFSSLELKSLFENFLMINLEPLSMLLR